MKSTARSSRTEIGTLFAVILQLLSCEPKLVSGTWSCPAETQSDASTVGGARPAASSASTTGSEAPAAAFRFTWSTSFENDFCDYGDAGGFCFCPGNATRRIVTEPVHSGMYAAEYTVDSDRANRSTQARCIRQGTFPSEAYYGAWYFIPAPVNRVGLWNLFHFQGGNTPTERFHDLWDVSLLKKSNGDLRLEFYNFGRSPLPDQSNAPAVPIGVWFQIELYVKRAADETGEFNLYQDGVSILRVTGVATDDSVLGQWYVGSLAEGIDPVMATVYVDDVSISPTR